MLKGCSRDICINPYCKNNPNFTAKSSSDAVKEALMIYKQKIEKNEDLSEVTCDLESQKGTVQTI